MMPPPLPVPASCAYLGGRWSPRARRFEGGVIARVPWKVVKLWAEEYRHAQVEADIAYLRSQKPGPLDQTGEMNLMLQALYGRVLADLYTPNPFMALLGRS